MTRFDLNPITRPSLDAELLTLLADFPQAPELGPDTLEMIRPYAAASPATALAGHSVDRREANVTSADGAELPLTVLTPSGIDSTNAAAPCVYWIHGGGMIMGNRYSQIDIPLDWLAQFGTVVVSIDYRLAPEVGGKTLVEDCYAGLLWLAEHAAQYGVDADKIIVAGTSAGGGLAAGTTLLARDRRGPKIAAQILICPMLDHRNDTISSFQFDGPAVWSRNANAFGWGSVLKDIADDAVPSCVSPSLASDLSGLPPTFIDVGSAEVFRDEGVDFASRIWATGGDVELHVWAGGFHGFDALFPQARVSSTARQTRSDWLGRTLRLFEGL